MVSEVPVGKKKFVIIDGKSVFYRGYYAMPNLSTKDGTPTGGVFGFATMALEIVKRLKPDYVAVAWDKPKTNIRKRLEIYPEYKAGRKPAPPDFKAQIPILHELLDAFGWPLYEMDDYEADDIMGALAIQASQKDIHTLLISSDLDMLQLVDEKVHMYALKKGLSNIELYSPKSFESKYGLRVDQFLDLKSLKGDSSDNIPGVPGIGEKGGISLLKEYESLDNIYDNLPLIKDSLKKKLEAGKELAYMSRELARLWTDAPIKLDLHEVDGTKSKPTKILGLLKELEFRTLARQLPDIMQLPADQKDDSRFDQLKTGKYTYIDSVSKLKEIRFNSPKRLFVYSRAKGKHGKNPQILILGDDSSTYALELESIPKDTLKEFIPNLPLIGYDLKTTIKSYIELGLPVPTVHHDVQVGAFLLNSLRREQTLTDLARSDLDYQGAVLENLDGEELITHSAEIVAVIKYLYKLQTDEFQNNPKLDKLAKEIEWLVIVPLARMEYIGIKLDSKYLNKFAGEINDMILDYEQQIYGFADKEFNISSPSQLAEVLFENLKLPTIGIKKGKTGYSTAARELDKLRAQHPIINIITLYREVSKLKNTYVDTLPSQTDDNGRVHTTFGLTTVQSGRLSSSDPNLQNIPIRTELGKHIRTAFVADKGNKLISADYSQFELRLAAVFANDTELIDMFNRGADIHASTAALIYGREVEDVTKQMRRAAKVINFGILYGMSPHGLSVSTGMTREQAVSFIDRYKKVRAPLFEYTDRIKDQARKDGYVETLFGRRRLMPDIRSSNFMIRQAAERAAINLPIQGTEADLMKMAMAKLDELLTTQHNNCNMLLQIHDSILVECPAEVAESIGEILRDTMENIYKLPVRLDVDVTIGQNWGKL